MSTPTGYFVQLPLTEERLKALLGWIQTSGRKVLITADEVVEIVGTPVADDVPVVMEATEFPNGKVYDGKFHISGADGREHTFKRVSLVRQSDHLAALAKVRAEIERLRDAFGKVRSIYYSYDDPSRSAAFDMCAVADSALNTEPTP